MDHVIYIFLFILGTILGSFWSVLVRRLRWKIDKKVIESILFGRSKCPNCHHQLWFFDLFPILSYIFSGWKCRYCKTKISSLYPSIEILTWVVFCLSYFLSQKFGLWNFSSLLFFSINYILVLILMFDILFYELGDFFYFSLISLVLVFFLIENSFVFSGQMWILYFLFFLLFYIFARFYATKKFGEPSEGFGYGDVLMALPIGMLISLSMWYSSIGLFLLVSSMIWIIFSIPSLIKWKLSSIPFLPAMIITTWIFLTFWDFLTKIVLN